MIPFPPIFGRLIRFTDRWLLNDLFTRSLALQPSPFFDRWLSNDLNCTIVGRLTILFQDRWPSNCPILMIGGLAAISFL